MTKKDQKRLEQLKKKLADKGKLTSHELMELNHLQNVSKQMVVKKPL